jgi:hypothetical protein
MEDASVLDNIRCLIHFFNIVWKGGHPYGTESAWITLEDVESHAANAHGPFPTSPVITVGSITEEYRHIVQERCICGGAFVSNLQSTASSASGQFDDINAACIECGSVHQFKFFLSSANSGPKLHLA